MSMNIGQPFLSNVILKKKSEEPYQEMLGLRHMKKEKENQLKQEEHVPLPLP